MDLPHVPIRSFAWLSRTVGLMAAAWFCLGGGGQGRQAFAQTDKATTTTSSEALFEQLLDLPSRYETGLIFNGSRFEDEVDRAWSLVTEDSTSSENLTLPSLWWSRNQMPTRWLASDTGQAYQIESYRLILGWTAFRSQSSQAHIIDVQVDPQYWNRRLSYAQQYAILNQFGSAGMSYGYQVRIYSSVRLVGVQACDFSTIPEFANGPGQEVPLPDLLDQNIQCTAAIGPFVQLAPQLDENLFAPP